LRFCLFFDRVPLPADQVTLKCYVAFLARSLNPSSIPGYLNVVRILHVNAGLPNPLKDNFEISMIRRGIARKLGRPPVQKFPVTIEILCALKPLLNLDLPEDIAFWAACLVAFYGLLRKNTLLPVSTCDKSSAFLVRGDLHGLSRHCFTLCVRQTKTIQFGQRVLSIPFVSCLNESVCPVSAVIAHLGGSVLPNTAPLFNYVMKGSQLGWTHAKFVGRLKSCLGKLGYDPANYSGHSFRRGGCTFCFEAGLDLISIKMRGDWKTQSFERYLHIPPSVILRSAIVMSDFAAKC
jgi:hypothetical protein